MAEQLLNSSLFDISLEQDQDDKFLREAICEQMDVLKAMLDQLKLRTRNDLIHGLA